MANTVTVACKLPHGLILRLFDMVDTNEPVAGGGYRTVPRAQPKAGNVVLKGYLTKHRFSQIQPAAETSSFALTHNVDKDFFDAWLKQNAELDLVKNGLVFAHEKDTAGVARERKDFRSGLEPVDPSKLPRRIQTANAKEEAA